MDTPVLGFLPSGRDEADNLGFLVYGDQADGCGATLGVNSGWCVEMAVRRSRLAGDVTGRGWDLRLLTKERKRDSRGIETP